MMPGMDSTEQDRFGLAFSFITAALSKSDDGPEIFSDLLDDIDHTQACESIVVLATGFVCLLDEIAQANDVDPEVAWQAFVAQAQQVMNEGLLDDFGD